MCLRIILTHCWAVLGRLGDGRHKRMLTPRRVAELEALTPHAAAVKLTRLRWLTTSPASDRPEEIAAEVGKLQFLRAMDAHALNLPMGPAERLIGVAARSSHGDRAAKTAVRQP